MCGTWDCGPDSSLQSSMQSFIITGYRDSQILELKGTVHDAQMLNCCPWKFMMHGKRECSIAERIPRPWIPCVPHPMCCCLTWYLFPASTSRQSK